MTAATAVTRTTYLACRENEPVLAGAIGYYWGAVCDEVFGDEDMKGDSHGL